MYQWCPKVGSSSLEIWSGAQEHMPAWLYPNHKWMQRRKSGLANLYAFLMRARDDWKVTPGIIGLSRLRVHIDGAVCYFDVGSSYPGCAEAAKGGGVHPLKGIVSWVHNAVRQLVWYLLGMLGVCGEGPFSTRGTKVRGLWSIGCLTRQAEQLRRKW